jgi:hypothetical protein
MKDIPRIKEIIVCVKSLFLDFLFFLSSFKNLTKHTTERHKQTILKINNTFITNGSFGVTGLPS